ncbi:MAG: 3-hydroxyacyl-CoA dehydrogenase family protein [Bacteroidota bacterium]|nr:3-hydroxyacyl-CoA dehydrogenase family protein [Bacteroidota bacterium]
MKVVILATNEQKEEIEIKDVGRNASLIFIDSVLEIERLEDFDAIFLLTDGVSGESFKEYPGKPVIIHSVVDTLVDNKLPSNYSRINAWPGFLKRAAWEMASNDEKAVDLVLKELGWNVVFVKDEPGFVAARVISMIINEAYFALEEKVSTIKEIDLAMKLGTNYPEGPFEWKDIIGIQNIYMLLQRLSKTDKRYLVAPLLQEEYRKSHHW